MSNDARRFAAPQNSWAQTSPVTCLQSLLGGSAASPLTRRPHSSLAQSHSPDSHPSWLFFYLISSTWRSDFLVLKLTGSISMIGMCFLSSGQSAILTVFKLLHDQAAGQGTYIIWTSQEKKIILSKNKIKIFYKTLAVAWNCTFSQQFKCTISLKVANIQHVVT